MKAGRRMKQGHMKEGKTMEDIGEKMVVIASWPCLPSVQAWQASSSGRCLLLSCC